MKGKVAAFIGMTLLLGIGLTAKIFASSPIGTWVWADRGFMVAVPFLAPVALIAAVHNLQVRLSLDSKISVSAALMVMLLLIYPASEAVSVIGLAVVAANLVLGRKLQNIIFNAGQHLVMGSVAALLAGHANFPFGTFESMAHMSLVGLAFMALNFVLVAAIVSLHLGLPFRQQFMHIIRSCWIQYGCLVLLGVLGAVLFHHSPAATLLLAIPLILVHRSYEDQVSLQRQTRETLEFLADLIDERDPHTFRHSQRVAELASQIARALGLGAEEREIVTLAARVHDIGKIGTDAEILMKRGPLTPDEVAEIRKHPVVGANIIGRLSHYQEIRELVLFHHKQFDGLGYPEDHRLPHGRLPLGAAIIAVADAFDAMTSDRPYRKALPIASAVQELRKNSGTQFAPEVVEAFVDKVLAEGCGQRALAGLVPRYQE
ncbi:MAG TPA: HD-GYP domain-containing protein [Firmicutes bacterium]|nr:HD-GYP domain-containing protein [Bacillota bacterium]